MLQYVSNSRRDKIARANDVTTDGQLRALAFTQTGLALEIPKIYRNELQIVLARFPVYTNFEHKLHKTHDRSSFFRESMSFTAAELGSVTTDIAPYTVVGYVPRAIQLPDRHVEYGVLGKVVPAHVIAWRESQLVPVVALLPKVGSLIRIFALIEPRDGLCTPYAVYTSAVFFRPEYRSSKGSSSGRYRDWNQMIRAGCERLVRHERVSGDLGTYKLMRDALFRAYEKRWDVSSGTSIPSTLPASQSTSLEDSDTSSGNGSWRPQLSDHSSMNSEESSVGLDSSSLTASRAGRIKKSIDKIRGWEVAIMAPQGELHEQWRLSTTDDDPKIELDGSKMEPGELNSARIAPVQETRQHTIRNPPTQGKDLKPSTRLPDTPSELTKEGGDQLTTLLQQSPKLASPIILPNMIPTTNPTTIPTMTPARIANIVTDTTANPASGRKMPKRKSDDSYDNDDDKSTKSPTKRRRLTLKYQSGTFEETEMVGKDVDVNITAH